ncbi:hypothetical protein PTKIN_Ptkin04bG0076600 [Pterospermum kingtungense]
MEKTEKDCATTTDEPQVNYRGFKAMPFVIGAFLSDTYFGRYTTLGLASISSFLGMVLLTLTAAVSKLHPPACDSSESGKCTGPTPWQMAFLLSGLRLMVVGAGVKPEGSPITSPIQVIVAAVGKRQLKQPEQPWISLFNHIPKTSINTKLSYSDQFR